MIVSLSLYVLFFLTHCFFLADVYKDSYAKPTSPIRFLDIDGVYGVAILIFLFGSQDIEHQVYIADISQDYILGVSFLQKHGCKDDLDKGTTTMEPIYSKIII